MRFTLPQLLEGLRTGETCGNDPVRLEKKIQIVCARRARVLLCEPDTRDAAQKHLAYQSKSLCHVSTEVSFIRTVPYYGTVQYSSTV